MDSHQNNFGWPDMVSSIFNPSTGKTQTGGSIRQLKLMSQSRETVGGFARSFFIALRLSSTQVSSVVT